MQSPLLFVTLTHAHLPYGHFSYQRHYFALLLPLLLFTLLLSLAPQTPRCPTFTYCGQYIIHHLPHFALLSLLCSTVATCPTCKHRHQLMSLSPPITYHITPITLYMVKLLCVINKVVQTSSETTSEVHVRSAVEDVK
jgi:hypothetical protein